MNCFCYCEEQFLGSLQENVNVGTQSNYFISSTLFKVCTYGPQIKQTNKQTKTHTVRFLGNFATEDMDPISYNEHKWGYNEDRLKVWAKTFEQEESKWFSMGFSAVYMAQ